ncbi:ribosome maturation factor RimP [Kineococcus esterisolvens]|uniref:ribosome maturation factor RimP n=1 Tax=unclassified Kineococcus TaxID=2621656 RepID=UPI003D7E4516
MDEAVAGVLEAVFADGSRSAGLALEEVSVSTAGRRRVVRVVVDLAGEEPGEVDLEAVAVVSAAVSETLDSSDVLGAAPYTLEVTSPGVDRPLTAPRHWARARGRLVRAVLAGGGELLGRVESVDADGVLLRLEPQPVKGRPPRAKDVGVPRQVLFAELLRGEVQVEFRRAGASPDDEPGELDDEQGELDDEQGELDDEQGELDDEQGELDDEQGDAGREDEQ